MRENAGQAGVLGARAARGGKLRDSAIRDNLTADFEAARARARVMNKGDNKLLFAVDLAGTLLFAIEGATAATAGNLDLLGVMVLAFATARAGGIIRDLLIGATPPASLRDWRYAAMAFTGGAIVFFLHRYVLGIPGPVLIVLDAAALALFAVAFVCLAVCGMKPPSGIYPILARICTAVYFAFFLLMPWYTKFDHVKPVPERVTGHA